MYLTSMYIVGKPIKTTIKYYIIITFYIITQDVVLIKNYTV